MTVFLSPRQGAFFLPLCGRNTIHATCRLLQVYPALLVPGSPLSALGRLLLVGAIKQSYSRHDLANDTDLANTH